MKKTFIALLAIVTVAACNKAEVIETVKDEAIEFSNAFVNNATKATDLTYGTVALTSFDVYGTVTGTNGTINIFNGAEVTGAVGNNVWSCDVKQYWIADATYKFAAVVDANSVAKDANNMPTALTYATDGQNDLLYAEATATGKASGNGKVNFTFSHLLSKAQFTVKSNTADGYYHNVTNIKVSNFATGTYTIDGDTWAGTTAADISFGNIERVTATDTDGKTNETQMLLIPSTTDFTVSFTVEIWNGTTKLSTQDYTKTVSQDLVKGNAYDFNLDLKVGELIQFTVTSNPTWAGETDVNVAL